MLGCVSTAVNPPIPKQPMGGTFLTAITLLGLFALFQLAAVGWHYLPLLRQQALQSIQSSGEEGEVVGEVRVTEGAPDAGSPPPADPATIARVSQIVSESDRNFRVGDFEATLRGLEQAQELMPAEPAIQFRLGQVFEALDDKARAFLCYEQSIAAPGLPPEVRRQAEQKMALLAQVLGDAGTGIPDAQTRFESPPAKTTPGQPVRDDIGLQPGAVLGIVSTRLRDSQPGAKSLSIAVKSRPGMQVDVPAMNVHVFFYEEDEMGEIVMTESKPTTQWISPPVDWSDGEPELLEVEYPLPDGGLPGSSADLGAPGRKFYGYVVGVYYDGELQDSRTDPGRLDSLHPLKLYLQSAAP